MRQPSHRRVHAPVCICPHLPRRRARPCRPQPQSLSTRLCAFLHRARAQVYAHACPWVPLSPRLHLDSISVATSASPPFTGAWTQLSSINISDPEACGNQYSQALLISCQLSAPMLQAGCN